MTDSSPVCLISYTYPPMTGGVATSARRLAGYLAEAGLKVHVVTPVTGSEHTCTTSSEEEYGIHVHRVVCDPLTTGDLTGFALRRYIKALDARAQFRLFHGFYLSVAHTCVSVANQPGRAVRPTILSLRGDDAISLMDHPGMRGMILAALARATWVTSVNQTYMRQLQAEVDLEGRCSVIYNGFSPLSSDRSRPRAGARSGAVGTVGEFRRVKDIPLLIRAYAALPPEIRGGLRLIGYFNSREEEIWSRMLIDEFGLAEETQITGRFTRADLAEYLNQLHVYVQSSAYDGVPNTVLEAASMGVPLVATAVGGLLEILEDGRSALLVPHGDPPAMTAAIRRILENPTLADSLSDGATQLAERFSAQREKTAWLELYHRLLTTSPPGGVTRAGKRT